MRPNSVDIVSIDLVDETAFHNLFDDYYIPLCLFADKYVENRDVAADITQECFVNLWLVRSKFTHLHSVKSFLYISVRNKCLNFLEHSRIVKDFEEKVISKNEDSFFHDLVIEEETYRILLDAINKLPKQTRTIMLLALKGMSNGEIAQQMDISIETVRSLKKMAYRKLRTLLKEYYYLMLLLLLN